MWARVLLKLYDLLWYILLPFVLLYLWWRGRRLPSYRQRIAERLGIGLTICPVDVWMHAVSVGEVVAASSMVQSCLDRGYRVVITTMTPTGSEQVKRMWGSRVSHQYCPYDFSFAIRRFLSAYQPRSLIIFETELWPGILIHCQRFKIPVLLVNARISNRSFGRYLKTKVIWRYVFSLFQGIYVQSSQDEERFLQLGVNSQILHQVGNLKFSQHIFANKAQSWREWKRHYPRTKIVVFGSTHPGEELLILQAWEELRIKHPHMMAIFVPRHPERFDEVFQLLNQHSHSNCVVKFSEWHADMTSIDYLLLDVMGELSSVYAIADVAFVGGSLVPIGGHNVLEPIAFGVPVITGSYIQNQQDLVRILLEEQAIRVVCHVGELVGAIEELLTHSRIRELQIEHSKRTLVLNQGATNICMRALESLMHQAP